MVRNIGLMVVVVAVFGLGYWAAASGFLTSNNQSETATTQRAPTPGSAQSRAGGGGNAVHVTTETVVLSVPRSRIQSIGTGKAVRSVKVTADVAGTVEKIHVQPNTDVAAGDPIVTLERKTQDILLGSARAERKKQAASFERYETLIKQRSTSISQAQVDEAQASLAVADANLAAADYEYDRRVIKAPFSGRINLNDLAIGSYLPQGAEIVTLIDTSSLLVEFSIPETAIAEIKPGTLVRLTTPALRGRVFNGRITAFDSSIDEEFRTLRVRAEVQNPQSLLVPGMTFSVSLASLDAAMPRVPSVAILWNRNGAFVWRLDANNQPERVDVVIRHRLRDTIWVEADLSEGDVIIVDGAFKVSQGTHMSIMVADPKAAGKDG